MRAVVFCFGLLRLMILQLVECLIRRLVVMFERYASEQFLPESAVLLFFSRAVGALGQMSGGLGGLRWIYISPKEVSCVCCLECVFGSTGCPGEWRSSLLVGASPCR